MNKERKQIIARIEYPSLELTVGRDLGRRGIPYLFRTVEDKNVLTVRVVAEYFFNIPITLENVDRTMGLIEYVLLRPEYAKEEIPGIKVCRDYGLARAWDKAAYPGSRP